MAAVMAVPSLAPRPSLHAMTSWISSRNLVEEKGNRPAVKQIYQKTTPSNSKKERPCDGCRRRKSKCVLQESRRCVLCEFHKQDCTFVEQAQPRKRKAEDNTTLNLPSKRSPVEARRSAPTPTPSVQSQPTSVSTPATSLSQPCMRKPFAVDESLSLQRHRHCKYIGPTTALDASLIALGSFNDENETESLVGTLRQVDTNEYFSTHADADVQLPDDEARALADIEDVVGSHGPALVDIYFRNVHPSYPIIQKQAFLDRHQHGDRQFNPPLLAAMYLLALAWWERDSSVSSHPKPDVGRLEYIAITSLTIAMQRPKISAVQAGLLMLQRPKSSTWTLTVQLVALGQDVGLHLDCSNWSIPQWEKLLRKRLAWALYTQDKWSAVMHGRPSHINAADWNVSLPSEEDFDENIQISPSSDGEVDAQQARGRVVFMQMISLTGIMAEVCDTFYSETTKAEYARAGRAATQLVLSRAKPVQLKLKEWFARLPASCKMESFTPPGQLSSQGYLHLAYFATEISIHRRIVQSLDPEISDPYLLYICRSAAKTRLISALDFVNRLKPEHLDAFWFFASASNFALIGTFGALLFATSPGKEEAHFYTCRLNEFKWTLSVSKKQAPWIQGALDSLKATSSMLANLPEKQSSTPTSERHMLLGTRRGGGAGGGAGGEGQGGSGDGLLGMDIEDWQSEATSAAAEL